MGGLLQALGFLVAAGVGNRVFLQEEGGNLLLGEVGSREGLGMQPGIEGSFPRLVPLMEEQMEQLEGGSQKELPQGVVCQGLVHQEVVPQVGGSQVGESQGVVF